MAHDQAANASLQTPGRLSLGPRRVRLLEAAAILAGILVLLASVIPNLGNHPAVTDDEVWVMSSAYKLAEEGVFGSDMFAGFYNAEDVYLFNMPAHHFMVAGSFKLLGAGVLQARVVGVAYGVATLVLMFLIARRLHGPAAGILSIGLLLFLRLNMGFDTGLPLQELSSSIRYDLAPVPFMLAAVLVLLGGSTWRRAAIAGGLLGLATLLQFYGAFAIPVAAAFLLGEPLVPRERLKLAGALAGVAALVCLPYGVYVLTHYDDFRGQAGTVDRRDDFSKPGFYSDSFLNEPDRFTRPLGFKEVPRGEDPRLVEPRYLSLSETLTRRPSAKLGVLVGLPLALAFTGVRALRLGSRGDRLLFACLAGLCLQYALLESLKLYIYWIPVVPLLCVGIAAASLRLLQPPERSTLNVVLAAGTVVCLLLFLAEGSAARLSGLRTAGTESDYDAIGRELRELVPADSRVVGSTSLWWPLRDRNFRSYFLFFYLTADNAGPYRTTIDAFLSDFDPDYLVLTRLGAEELDKHLVPADLAAYRDYLGRHATLVTRLEGPDYRSYGFIDIWRFN